jgi:PBSX family phage terminase large subunit
MIVTERRSENKIIIQLGGHVNTYYLFGGRDESSFSLIQGLTLAGVLFDEVALMPRSFVEQALARCSVPGSKFWFNCNPDTPQHWFYQEWVLKHNEKNVLYQHYTMKNNLSLSKRVIERYENLYSGVFYERYIKGRWVVAEGLIYTMFDPKTHIVPTAERDYKKYMVSCDYGTINPMSIGLWGLCDGIWYRVREYYFSSRRENTQKTDEEYYDELERLVDDCTVERVIVDPSAASFIECIRKHGRFYVQSANNDVLNGIRDVATQLRKGVIKFNDCCKDSIREFGLYRWDEKAKEDKPIKTDDHAMDDIRYFVHTAFAPRRFF